VSRRAGVAFLAAVLAPVVAVAAPRGREPQPDPRGVSPLPSYVQRVAPALLGLSVRAAEGSVSARRLGARRFGAAVLFDPRGYAVTVSYLLLDAVGVEARMRDGRRVPARVAGMDLDTGLGLIQLQGAGPFPAAALAPSQEVGPGARTATVGVDEDNDLIHTGGMVTAVRRFAAFWEYMLDRAFIVSPALPGSWGGSALVDEAGGVIGIVSLRLGEAPHANLAIPAEKFLPVKDELVASGRVTSRPPRPWIGLYTVSFGGAVYVDGVNEAGPAAGAGFRRGDQIVRVDGVSVNSQEEFYERMWRRRAGDTIEVGVRRADGERVISVRSIDRHRLYRASE